MKDPEAHRFSPNGLYIRGQEPSRAWLGMVWIKKLPSELLGWMLEQGYRTYKRMTLFGLESHTRLLFKMWNIKDGAFKLDISKIESKKYTSPLSDFSSTGSLWNPPRPALEAGVFFLQRRWS